MSEPRSALLDSDPEVELDEALANLDLAEASLPGVEVATLIRPVVRLFQERLGAERETIGFWLAAFSAVLDRQDPREIAQARQQLTELLDSVDRGMFL